MWETVLTFLFIAVAYASVFVRPGHGDASPLAAGLTLFAALATGGCRTGQAGSRHDTFSPGPTKIRLVLVVVLLPQAAH